MSVITPVIKIGKKVKKKLIKPPELMLSPVRRIERVATEERLCAMTFDDGPFALPPSPSQSSQSLTDLLLDILAKYDAKGTFDVVGDTSGNYPDEAGKLSSPSWGGIAYDHYPDIGQDHLGGVIACPDLVRRIIAEGHEVTNHGYAHILFGKKPLVYGKRQYFKNIDEVIADLRKLHDHMEKEYSYTMKLSRPPHYVDNIAGGVNSYDAYQQLGYQYMAASFDGAGWLPRKTYEEEVGDTHLPLTRLLRENPDALCGQIIFQKDGYNMAKRTPIADGLEKQLDLLKTYDYKVVTVSQLMEHSPFTDVSIDVKSAQSAKELLALGKCLVYRDNSLRLYHLLTRGELAMVFFGIEQENHRLALIRDKVPSKFSDIPTTHPYRAAIEFAVDEGYFTPNGNQFSPKETVSGDEFNAFCDQYYHANCAIEGITMTHRAMIKAMKHLEHL